MLILDTTITISKPVVCLIKIIHVYGIGRPICKRALHHDAVDIPTTLEYREARTIYRDFFLRKWQAEWATSDTGSHYRVLEPTVSLARKFGDRNRRKEVAIN